ncbi:MAG TPA: MarR family transcriptional regulator [Ktedonobacteraceae bacterium]|nr:MarR family transcriptional regulator [Ktedonobacteraceae bacterium]
MRTNIEDNLGYWLFYTQRSVAHAFSEVLQKGCEEQGKLYVITPAQFGVLAMLFEMGDVTIGLLSKRRGLDAPTITGIVKRLEQNGLVERVYDREDRRVVKVYLTEEGKEIMKALGDPVDAFYDVLTQGFSEAEQSTLRTNLHRIITNVAAVAPGTGDRFGLLPRDSHCNP